MISNDVPPKMKLCPTPSAPKAYKGMTATGGAAGVGRAVNEAVVTALLGVFIFNYLFTQTMLATNPDIQTIK